MPRINAELDSAREFLCSLPRRSDHEYTRDERDFVQAWVRSLLERERLLGQPDFDSQLLWLAMFEDLGLKFGVRSLAQYALNDWAKQTHNAFGAAYARGLLAGSIGTRYYTKQAALTQALKKAKRKAVTAANARHSKPGGSRDSAAAIREIWATGKFADRTSCAEQEWSGLFGSYETARRALRNTPDPDPWPAKKAVGKAKSS